MAIVTPYGYAGTGSIVPGGNAPTPSITPTIVPPTAPTTTTLAQDQAKAANQGKPGYDALGNAVATPPASSASPSDPSYYSRYTPQEQAADTYLNQDFKAPQTVDQIQTDMAGKAQGEIDNLNKYYDSLLKEQSIVNEGRTRGTSSVSTLTGLAGSSEANVAADKTSGLNANDNAKIQNERGVAIGGILSKIRASAVEEARAQRLEARQSATDILAGRTQRQTEAVSQLTELAKGGVTAAGLAKTDPESYQHLAQMVGGETRLQALITLNRPVETVLDKRVEGGKYVIAFQNPIDGKVRMETVDLGLKPGSVQVADAGGYILFGHAGSDGKWDGDMGTTTKISKTLSPDQAADNQLQRDKLDAQGGYTVDENGNVIETGNFDALTIGRYNKAANAATSILQKNPTFKNILGSSAYLDRIEAAVNHPGSVGDQELLDAFTQLNTGGNRVTEAQVHLITNNQSIGDLISKYAQKLTTGGSLSTEQRNQIVKLAKEVYGNYQRSYQPLYEDATKRLAAQGVPKQFWNIPDPKTLSRAVSDGSDQGNTPAPVTAPDGTQVIITD